MERERQHTRDPDHKVQLRDLKKSKLLIKDMLDKTKKQCQDNNYDYRKNLQ